MISPELREKLRFHRNEAGLPTQANGDMGDTANRIGALYSCMAAMNEPFDDQFNTMDTGLRKTLSVLCTDLPAGRYRRGYAPGRWFNNPDNMTRDQMVPLECAMALCGEKDLAREHLKLRLPRFLFHFSTQNDGADAGPLVHKLADPCTPTELAVLIRAARLYVLYPLLLVLDLFVLLDVLLSFKTASKDSDNTLLPQVLATVKVMKTPLAPLIRLTYSKRTDVANKLRVYHAEGPSLNGFEALGEIMVLAYKEIFK